MNKKRDYILEITSKKSRLLKRSDRWAQFTKRNDPILSAIQYIENTPAIPKKEQKELLKYFPIGMVACIEGYFRLAIADLIDFGDPYQTNLEDFKELKLDIKTTLGIYNKKISLGELISHIISISSLDDINKHMSMITGEDFLKKLMNTKVDLIEGKYEKLSDIAPTLYKDIKVLFEQRHIYAHELAIKEKINLEVTSFQMAAATVFVYSTELLMEDLLAKKP